MERGWNTRSLNSMALSPCFPISFTRPSDYLLLLSCFAWVSDGMMPCMHVVIIIIILKYTREWGRMKLSQLCSTEQGEFRLKSIISACCTCLSLTSHLSIINMVVRDRQDRHRPASRCLPVRHHAACRRTRTVIEDQIWPDLLANAG
jgi:hypothetical protein